MNTTALGFLALLIAGGTGFLWLRAAHQVQLPKNRSGFIAVLLGAGALGAIALAKGPGWIGGVPAVLAIIIGAFFCFTVAISRQKVGVDAIRVGSTIPEFTAPDETVRCFTHRPSPVTQFSLSSSAPTGDPTVSPSCGDGKSFGPSSMRVVYRS